MDEKTIGMMAQFLGNEYAALQAARRALISEVTGRTSSFLGTISAGFVALALVSQLSQFGEAFLVFSLVLLPLLGFVGLSAYVRLVQLDLADYAYTSAINRIRHFQVQTMPEIEPYLSFPAFDDERSVLRGRVIYTSLAWTVMSYPSGLLLVINSLIAGALCSIVISMLFRIGVLPAAGAGAMIFLLAAAIQYRLGVKWAADVRADFEPRFPKPVGSQQS